MAQDPEIQKITEQVQAAGAVFGKVREEVGTVVLGAEDLTDSLLRAVLCGGHVLLEGLPGLAKTMLAETFAGLLGLDYKRIQFTPDLLPADLTGGEIYSQQSGDFSVRKGPLFTQVLLADEINRAPAKVQAALLESMAEKKITIGLETFALEEPYLVMATQNPIEQEGTYPLPEAQTDRFMFKVMVTYPERDAELAMMEVHSGLKVAKPKPVTKREEILKARDLCEGVYADEKLKHYIVDLVRATRELNKVDEDLAGFVDVGASPRATLALLRGARANAFLNGRGFATPEDVQQIAYEVLRHRILLSYNALAEEITPDLVLKTLLQRIEVP